MYRLDPRTVLAISAAASLAAGAARAQEWTFPQKYSDGRVVPGTLKLTEADGDARVRFITSNVHECLRGNLKTKVEKTPTAITITPEPNMNDCPRFRWVFNTDGSGAYYEAKQAESWERRGKLHPEITPVN